MLAIEFRFPAGSYHATPWGRQVNEAEAEWPPSPWRILRALIATWHRKADPARWPEALLESLVARLSQSLPSFVLPPAGRAHSRHYMPVGAQPVLIFDAFVHLDREVAVIAAWPDVTLSDEERGLCDVLLRDMGYLGRAESWADACVSESYPEAPNCVPSPLAVDPESGAPAEPVRVIAPIPATDYSTWREETRRGLDWQAMKPKLRAAVTQTLPATLIEALRLETADIQAAGWSCPPGARFVSYRRPYAAFAPAADRRIRRAPRNITAVRLALMGKPLPRIEDAVRIGEVVRLAAIRQADRLDGQVPPALSGHDLSRDEGHAHAFYLPEDADGDGHIDHVLVYARGGLPREAVLALGRIRRLWLGDGGEWRVVLEGSAEAAPALGSRYCVEQPRRTWRSATPYLRPWHVKKHFDVAEQVARECELRHFPPPRVEPIPAVRIRGRERRPVHFHRFRSKRGLAQPDTRGAFLRLTFPEPVGGPIALGFACHFGLGLFVPDDTNAPPGAETSPGCDSETPHRP